MLDQALIGATVDGPSIRPDDLAAFWGPVDPPDRPRRLLGLFAHPDDEVFCVAGTMARCAQDGASTAVVSLTQGEAGQIRDTGAATRRTLGATRSAELARAAHALGVAATECLDLGDGVLARRSLGEIAAVVRTIVDHYAPDVIVTFGPDGAFGHPDHITSCLATIEAIRTMPEPPRLLHARFPARRRLLLDLIVEWLMSSESRFTGTAAFGHALKLFADGSTTLGLAADHLRVEWFPAGSYLIEQGEAASELFCILSGSVDIVVDDGEGRAYRRDTAGAGSFVGEEGIATGNPRNANVIARDDVTCLVLAPEPRDTSQARGAQAAPPARSNQEPDGGDLHGCITVDVSASVDRKIAALTEHRSQYALDADLLPRSMLTNLLGTEHFAVARFASN